jgi:hypothetical protein
MNLSGLDLGLWATIFIGHVVLFTILLLRIRWRQFTVFTTLIGWNVVNSIVLYLFYRQSAWGWYTRAYWAFSILDFALQLGVIWEIARTIMRPTGIWSQEARRFFLLWAVLGILLAATLAWLIAPPADNLAGSLKVKAFMFTGFVICELCLVMLITADRYGLGWRNHVMALVTGWSVWALVFTSALNVTSQISSICLCLFILRLSATGASSSGTTSLPAALYRLSYKMLSESLNKVTFQFDNQRGSQ